MIERLNAALEDRYRIERELGEGGMATVYLADDLKHNRKVAIKVLKPELAAVVGAERFLAEIEVTANLQHPHILPLFDSGEAGGFLYFVMPYIEGETLADRLERDKQLPVDEAVGIASAVASALAAAHDQGVVHRDIKPGNILMSRGEPLVADFGISLAVTAAGGNRLTETGLSMGTPFYMSPEQATGDREVGVQSDIYALGCVLYEMLVGDPPYVGSTAQAVLGKILTETPRSPTAVRTALPRNVEAAVLKALEKLPADRFASVSEFAKALANPGFRHGRLADAEAAPGVDAGPWRRLALALGGTAALLAVALGWSLLAPGEPEPVRRFAIDQPEGHAVGRSWGSNVVISPDGSILVYVGPGAEGESRQLWMRRLDQLDPVPLAGTQGARSPRFSPDGRRIAFIAGRGLHTVSLGGEPPLRLVEDEVGGLGVAWGAGYVYYALEGGGLARVRESSGDPEVLAAPDAPDGTSLAWPDVLPNGEAVLVSVSGASFQDVDTWRIAVLDVASGERTPILSGVMARYVRSGHLVYVAADGTLLAVPFDAARRSLAGDPVALAPGVGFGFAADVDLTVSDEGTLLYGTGADRISTELVWVARDGVATPIDPDWEGVFSHPVLSPDETRLAVNLIGANGESDVWVKQLDRGPSLRLTLDPAGGYRPEWTSDGTAVTFYSSRAGNSDAFTRRADGSAQTVLELDAEDGISEVVWSPDGAWLLYRTDGGGGIYGVPRDREGDPVTLIESDAGELSPTLSPDGRFMAFTSSETGRDEVYVVPFPNTADARWAVSTGGGREVLWSPAGDELFYIDGSRNMVAVPVTTDPSFTFAAPRVLFSAEPYRSFRLHRHFDVTADGQRFVMVTARGADDSGRLVLVQNFFQELEDEVGPGG